MIVARGQSRNAGRACTLDGEDHQPAANLGARPGRIALAVNLRPSSLNV
jgi:hypothetical protein